MKETALIHQLMLGLSDFGVRLFRNNCGTLKDERGNFIRYGVCNPGGSDCIGYTCVKITPEMVGKRIAVFTAIEAKTGRTTTTTEQAQFISAVWHAGGIALIAREDAVDPLVAWASVRDNFKRSLASQR